MPVLTPQGFAAGASADAALFGGNVLAPRTTMEGAGSYGEAIDDLGVTGLRYPGGSLTEFYFDISNPDADVVTHAETGETCDFIPLSEFMNYAGDNGHAVTIVIPTRDQLSESWDAEGDRFADIDEEALREFIHGVAAGEYGEAEIAGFEIGNEYWGSGQMNATEYGRVASEMAAIIKDELRIVSETYDIDTDEMSVLAQMGHNHGTSKLSSEYEGWDAEDVIDDLQEAYPDADLSYDNIRGNGEPNWTEINNELIRMAFDTPEEIDALDGIIAHVYSKGPDNENSRTYDLDSIQNSWLEKEGFENLEIHVTEWNLKSTDGLDREEDYGLYQAHEMLDIVEEFMAAGVDQAHVWPLIQNTSNPLSMGMDYTGATVPGEMFSMMAQNIPGKSAIDFSPGGDRSTELEGLGIDMHAFAGQGDMVLYLAAGTEPTLTDVDLSGLVSGFDSMEISVLGVAPGQAPGSTSSEPDIQQLDADEVYQDGFLEADLDSGEIMQVIIRGLEPTEEFAPTIAAIDAQAEDTIDPEIEDEIEADQPDEDESDDTIEGIPLIPPQSEDEDEAESDEDSGDGGDDGGLGDICMALAIIPLIALLGMGMGV